MTDSNESLSLEEVKKRFIESEVALKKMSASLQGIGSVSEHLESARDSISQVADRVGNLAVQMAELAVALASATDTIRKSDPSIVLEEVKKLGDIASQADAKQQVQGGLIGEMKSDLATTKNQLESIAAELVSANQLVSTVKTLAIVAASASVLALATALYSTFR